MKVFISWSGETSQKSAQALKDWLEQCIQTLEVFFSSEDIEKGTNWNAKLTSELNETNYGIVCLTSENVTAPWIHFEAGALSKMLPSKVMVLAVNISFSEIVGPLKSFQATKFEKDDIFKLLQSINNSQEKPLAETKLTNSFEAFWPQLQKSIETIKSAAPIKKVEKSNSRQAAQNELLDEMLQMLRDQNAMITHPDKLLPFEYFERVLSQINIRGNDYMDSIDGIFDEIYTFSAYCFRELPISNNEVFEDFMKMVNKVCRFAPSIWRKRFDHLFNRYNTKMIHDV